MTGAVSYVVDSYGPGDGFGRHASSYVVCTLWDTGEVHPGGGAVVSETWSYHETLEEAREAYGDDIAAGADSATVARVIMSTDYPTGGDA